MANRKHISAPTCEFARVILTRRAEALRPRKRVIKEVVSILQTERHHRHDVSRPLKCDNCRVGGGESLA